MDSKNHDDIITWLYGVIDKELEKPDNEADMDLISECSDFLDKLTADEIVFSESELKEKLNILKLQAERNQSISMTKKPQKENPGRKRTKRRYMFRICIAAAILFALFAGINVAARINGYNSVWEFFKANISEILNLKPNEIIQEGGIAIVRNSGTKKYATIEELLEQENFDILYPAKLPDNVEIKTIYQHWEDEGKFTLEFKTSSHNLNILISNYYFSDLSRYSDIYKTEQMDFAIIENINGTYSAIAQNNGYEYSFTYNDYDGLLKILDNMKGI